MALALAANHKFGVSLVYLDLLERPEVLLDVGPFEPVPGPGRALLQLFSEYERQFCRLPFPTFAILQASFYG